MKRTKTEKALMQAAQKVFWKYGYKKVNISDICEEAAVSKMSFYRYFNNKTDIAGQVLEEYIDNGLREHRKILESNLPFVEKLEEVTHLKLQQADGIGMEFLQELMIDAGNDFQVILAQKRLETLEMIMNTFKKAQEQGDIRKDLNLDMIPILSENLTELAKNEQLLKMVGSTRALIKEITTFFFYGIVSHPKHP